MKKLSEQHFGEWFRKHRQAKDISVRKLAKELNVSATYISMVERGDVAPFSIEHIKQAQELIGYQYDTAVVMANRCSHCGARLKNDNR